MLPERTDIRDVRDRLIRQASALTTIAAQYPSAVLARMPDGSEAIVSDAVEPNAIELFFRPNDDESTVAIVACAYRVESEERIYLGTRLGTPIALSQLDIEQFSAEVLVGAVKRAKRLGGD